MKVIVTGGAGYIGSHVCLALHRIGVHYTVVDNFSNSSPLSVDRLEQLLDKPINCIEADVCHLPDVLSLFEQEQPAAVIHCAGLKAVGESCAKPLLYYEQNILGTLNVLKAMDKTQSSIIFPPQRPYMARLIICPLMRNIASRQKTPTGVLNFLSSI